MGGESRAALHSHAVVTLLFWMWLFAAGTVYNIVRWVWYSGGHTDEDGRGHRYRLETGHSRNNPVALVEASLPIVLLVLIALGWQRQCIPLYLLGPVHKKRCFVLCNDHAASPLSSSQCPGGSTLGTWTAVPVGSGVDCPCCCTWSSP